ncbi:MAG: hypothetical protein M0P69_01185 [Bacteroidales bacterium]|jgi:uncharacterized protein (TIGR02145 family)|nr:hypothetical protein [Bacteroidales bacterium]MDD2570112.1 FISUMP domain-containing protein [Bacteroidales bacterium]MDD2812042.1 FISUMP domain-containing protein [Bacteroidales bacterium]MDD3385185.1 FISUMP domain-containing protein [Bacteroidales bacterium]MDD3811033.1 FISUMP domain-containing protein [Bacteroidales bacterium]
MKRLFTIIASMALASGLSAQEHACKQDRVQFMINPHRGSAQWQQSSNGTDWSVLEGASGDTLNVSAEQNIWFRASIAEGECQEIHSDAIQLIVHDVPIVSLTFRDSICVSESAIVLSGGTPDGGNYWGPGVIDGKFIPSEAGPGLHAIHYRYRNPENICADTASVLVQILPLPDSAIAGDDLSTITSDSVRLNANAPVNGTGSWSIVNGIHGHFSDINDPNSWFIRDSSNLDFTLRWTIVSRCGSESDEVDISFFQLSINPCPGAPTMTDDEGNVYPTVQIGDQCWMARSLNIGKMVNSTVKDQPHSNVSNNGIIEKYCYNNDPYNCDLYGGLYDWDEAMRYTEEIGARGICPEGWHIPSDEDWKEIVRFYKYGDGGAHLKVGGDSGFEGHFSGNRNRLGGFFSFDATGYFMESGWFTVDEFNDGYVRQIAACNGYLARERYNKRTGVSVRCVKDK